MHPSVEYRSTLLVDSLLICWLICRAIRERDYVGQHVNQNVGWVSSNSRLTRWSRVSWYLVNISANSANWYSTEGCTNYTRSLELVAYMLFLFFTLQGCALGKTKGSPVPWNCEMIFMKKLKFSSHPRVIGVRGRQVLLEHILTLYIVLVIYSQQSQMSKSLNSSTKEKLDSSVTGRRKSSLERSLRSLKVWVKLCLPTCNFRCNLIAVFGLAKKP